MADRSAIEWTEATWNPVTGCSKVSPGCAHCYAEAISLRFGTSRAPWTPSNAAKNVVLHPERLEQPFRWRRPRMIFVNSMSDLFHELIPLEFVQRIFEVMRAADRHTFQVLTKRPERALELAASLPWPANIWLGVSIENSRSTFRADVLRELPAAIRVISAEPLLGSLFESGGNKRPLNLARIDWLIAGGESGPRYRPVRLEWIRELRDACSEAGVAFFLKQIGGRTSKIGGAELDGCRYEQMPAARAASG